MWWILIIVLILLFFIISGGAENTIMIRSDIIKENCFGFPEVDSDPDILYQDGIYASNKNRYKSNKKMLVGNNLIIPNIVEKYKLSQISKYNPEEWVYEVGDDIDKLEDIFDGKILIIKPSGNLFYKGKGIFITDKFDVFKKKINKNVNYVISTYLRSDLIKDRKFHIRYYVLVGQDKKTIEMPELSYCQLAKKPYVEGEWDDKDIHDTHWIDFDYAIPLKDIDKYLDSKGEIIKQINKIVKDSIELAEPVNYGDSEYTYVNLGFDLMVSKGKVYLLEINDKVGFDGDTKTLCEKNKEMVIHGLSTI